MIHQIKKMSYLIIIGLFAACTNAENDGNNQDTKDVAEEQNEDKFNTKEGEKDAQFIVDVVSGNYYEIRLAKYAEQNSSTESVRSMAGKMVTDHNAMLNGIKAIAASKSITVPAEDSSEVATAIKDLHDKKTSDFDKEWTNKMLDKHKASINKMEAGLKDVTDPEIKSWIETNLPTVRSHFDMLNQMHDADMKH